MDRRMSIIRATYFLSVEIFLGPEIGVLEKLAHFNTFSKKQQKKQSKTDYCR